MMNQQQPDKFFREKLQGYQRPAPAAAWDRIELGLEKKKNKKFLWWKIAACFILVAAATYVLWFYESTSVQTELAHTKDKTESPRKEAQSEELGKTDKIQDVPAVAENKQAIVPQTTAKNSQRKQRKSQQDNLPAIVEHNPIEKEPVQEVDTPEPVTPIVADHSLPSVKSSRIKITIKSEETNKYLNENALAEATAEEKKPSTLKKLLKKANDLKSNQDPFGDLREKKNEILALNFKNEKRGENK